MAPLDEDELGPIVGVCETLGLKSLLKHIKNNPDEDGDPDIGLFVSTITGLLTATQLVFCSAYDPVLMKAEATRIKTLFRDEIKAHTENKGQGTTCELVGDSFIELTKAAKKIPTDNARAHSGLFDIPSLAHIFALGLCTRLKDEELKVLQNENEKPFKKLEEIIVKMLTQAYAYTTTEGTTAVLAVHSRDGIHRAVKHIQSQR